MWSPEQVFPAKPSPLFDKGIGSSKSCRLARVGLINLRAPALVSLSAKAGRWLSQIPRQRR